MKSPNIDLKSPDREPKVAVLPKKAETKGFQTSWKFVTPVAVAIVIAFIPAPAGLPQHAWYYFALFAAVIVGLMLEPLPGGAIGISGVTLATLLAPWVLYGPADLAKPGFNPSTAAINWALSGFSNATVWLIFGAFMFALGYEKTGLGRRIALVLVKRMGRKTLTLGYAVAAADTALEAEHRPGGCVVLLLVPAIVGAVGGRHAALFVGEVPCDVGDGFVKHRLDAPGGPAAHDFPLQVCDHAKQRLVLGIDLGDVNRIAVGPLKQLQRYASGLRQLRCFYFTSFRL